MKCELWSNELWPSWRTSCRRNGHRDNARPCRDACGSHGGVRQELAAARLTKNFSFGGRGGGYAADGAVRKLFYKMRHAFRPNSLLPCQIPRKSGHTCRGKPGVLWGRLGDGGLSMTCHAVRSRCEAPRAHHYHHVLRSNRLQTTRPCARRRAQDHTHFLKSGSECRMCRHDRHRVRNYLYTSSKKRFGTDGSGTPELMRTVSAPTRPPKLHLSK